MNYGLYLSAAGMMAQQHRTDVIANNLANVNTTGFKRDLAVFQARPVESQASAAGMRYRDPILDRLGGGLFQSPTFTEFVQGAIELTSSPLSVCINGPGLFAVQEPDGQVRYTRDGQFAVDPQTGTLTTHDGKRSLLDEGGKPILLDAGKPVEIAPDGTITQNGQQAGRLCVTEFANPQLLRKRGENLYDNPGGTPGTVKPARVVSGAVEKSTVDPVTELVALIQAQRSFEANARMIRIQDETIGRVINDLPQNV